VETTRYDVRVRLSGEDGNAFAIIGKVSLALKRAGYTAVAAEFRDAAFKCESYDALLRFAMETVEVE